MDLSARSRRPAKLALSRLTALQAVQEATRSRLWTRCWHCWHSIWRLHFLHRLSDTAVLYWAVPMKRVASSWLSRLQVTTIHLGRDQPRDLSRLLYRLRLAPFRRADQSSSWRGLNGRSTAIRATASSGRDFGFIPKINLNRPEDASSRHKIAAGGRYGVK